MRRILLVLAAALAAFGLALAGSFHFDDFSLFSDLAVTSPGGWLEVWRPVQTRPLTWLSFWMNYQLGGAAPPGYHAVNLALHAGTAVMLLVVLRRLVDTRVALMAALLFAVHPIQTEPVAYIFARGTLLCTLLSLLALWLSLTRRDWWAVLAFAGALLAKEECAAFPLFIAALWFSRKTEHRKPGPMIAMLALSLVAGLRVIWATSIIRGAGAAFGAGVTPWEYASYQGEAILRYLSMLIVPWGFTIDPELSRSVLLRSVAWALVLAAAIAATRWWRRREPGFWFLSGLILLLPSSSIFPADDLAADRRMYLPMIAFSVCLAMMTERLRPYYRAAAVVALAAVSAGYCWIWRSDFSLWTEAVHRAPDKVRPRIWLSRSIPPEQALGVLAQAERNAPDSDAVASEQGRVYLQLGRPADALTAFGRALALKPGDAEAVNNRGVALQLLGQRDAAIQDFRRALSIDPCLFHARYNLKLLGVATPAGQCRFTPDQRKQLLDQ